MYMFESVDCSGGVSGYSVLLKCDDEEVVDP
jgi:hypothetical protein